MTTKSKQQRRQVTADAILPPTSKQKTKPVPEGAIWLSARQLLDRFGGRSAMWLHRRLHPKSKDGPAFPQPAYDGRLMFFRLSDIERYEREIIKRSHARGQPTAATSELQS
jgi:hypothetical protein